MSDWSDRVRALSPAKRALLEELTRRRAASSSSSSPLPAGSVELLREGAGGPIVLAHPIGGSLFCYVELCQAIGASHPVWGVAADAVLAEPAELTIEELARGYVASLAAAGVTRPAAVAGWSFGGLLAYEMARQWAAQLPVVLIDAVPWPGSDPPWDQQTTLRTFAEYLLGLAGQPALTADPALWRLPVPDALAAADAALREQGNDLGFTGPELTRRYWMYANAARAMSRYLPPPYAGPVTLIRTAETAASAASAVSSAASAAGLAAGPAAADWPAGAGSPLTVLPVPGDHFTVLRPPVVARVAQAVTDAAAGRYVRPSSP